ncbi:MAG: hypothetical protein JXB26_07225 [Candidatus Aminicenantes bacterium]|nr:hypothetical protein [Candidatus Aminicenantes bacterium]
MKKWHFIWPLLFLIAVGLQAEEKSGLRFQVEFYGGFSTAKPEDLNLACDAEEKLNAFLYNGKYEYLNQIHYIDSYSYSRSGDYKRIKHVFPFGFKVKAMSSSGLGVSLGFKYFCKTQESYPKEEFSIIENSGRSSQEVLEYSPLQLGMEGKCFTVGLHLGRDLGNMFRIEGYLSPGLVFGNFTYSMTQNNHLYYGDSGLEFDYPYSMELRGKGKGLAFDAGFQFYMKLSNHLRLFFMGGYSYQQVKNLSGHGEQNVFGDSQNWEGNIYLIEEPYSEPWGKEQISFLSNIDVLVEYYMKRKMNLNMSGLSINIGMAFRI